MLHQSLHTTFACLFSAASLTLYGIGVAHGDDARHFYIPAVLCAIVAATCLIIRSLDEAVDRVLRRELAVHRVILAESIAAALEYDEDEAPTAQLRLIGQS